MKEHDTAQGLITVGQMKEIGSAVFQSIPTNLSFRTAEEWKGNKDYLSNQLKKLLREGVPDLVAWQKFFKKYFGKDLNLSILQIPPKQEGFDRVIIIPKGITIGQVYEVCSKNFPCWKWTEDLIGAASQNDRSS
ncbi:hypothetical protein KKA24_00150, partial [Patescibacteria group bacterium]|nr:hypothetical protein [Patescibacteria group bacterium]